MQRDAMLSTEGNKKPWLFHKFMGFGLEEFSIVLSFLPDPEIKTLLLVNKRTFASTVTAPYWQDRFEKGAADLAATTRPSTLSATTPRDEHDDTSIEPSTHRHSMSGLYVVGSTVIKPPPIVAADTAAGTATGLPLPTLVMESMATLKHLVMGDPLVEGAMNAREKHIARGNTCTATPSSFSVGASLDCASSLHAANDGDADADGHGGHGGAVVDYFGLVRQRLWLQRYFRPNALLLIDSGACFLERPRDESACNSHYYRPRFARGVSNSIIPINVESVLEEADDDIPLAHRFFWQQYYADVDNDDVDGDDDEDKGSGDKGQVGEYERAVKRSGGIYLSPLKKPTRNKKGRGADHMAMVERARAEYQSKMVHTHLRVACGPAFFGDWSQQYHPVHMNQPAGEVFTTSYFSFGPRDTMAENTARRIVSPSNNSNSSSSGTNVTGGLVGGGGGGGSPPSSIAWHVLAAAVARTAYDPIHTPLLIVTHPSWHTTTPTPTTVFEALHSNGDVTNQAPSRADNASLLLLQNELTAARDALFTLSGGSVPAIAFCHVAVCAVAGLQQLGLLESLALDLSAATDVSSASPQHSPASNNTDAHQSSSQSLIRIDMRCMDRRRYVFSVDCRTMQVEGVSSSVDDGERSPAIPTFVLFDAVAEEGVAEGIFTDSEGTGSKEEEQQRAKAIALQHVLAVGAAAVLSHPTLPQQLIYRCH